jgi:DNA-binding NarL/FixJ family response regulator
LAPMVKEKSFCAKLYDRLKAFTIRIPALHDQAQNIPELMWGSLDRPARGTQMRFHPEAVAMLNADTFKTHDESPLQRSLHTSSVPKTAPIRILIVDSQPIYQEGLRIVLEAQPDMLVVGKVTTAIEAVAEFRHHKPDVTLMGHCVKSLPGLDAAPFLTIRAEFPRAHIIILSTADGEAGIRGALKAGAASYVLKDAPPNELLQIVRSVYRGQKSIPSAVAARLAENPGSEDLTPRELDVLQLIRDGSKNKQIADKLSISQTTVTFHIRNIMDKLQADDRTHAVTVALRRGHLLLQ